MGDANQGVRRESIPLQGMRPDAYRLRFLYPMIGVVVLLSFYIPYLLSGDGIVVKPHDQLDGEVFTYILRARHLGADSFPELMGGLPCEGMQMSSPASLALYQLFPPETAFAINHLFVALVGFASMYLLCCELEVRASISLVSSLLFVCLPFYSVYGLCVMGVPLAAFACLRVRDRDGIADVVVSCALVAFYAACSSPVLVGFAVAGCIIFAQLFMLIMGRARYAFRLAALLAVLVIVYCALNLDLLQQALAGSSYVSHKSEVVLSSVPFSLRSMFDFVREGRYAGQQVCYHATSSQRYIFTLVISVAIACGIGMASGRIGREERVGGFLKGGAAVLGFLILSAFLYGVFHCHAVTRMRDMLPGALRSFQLDRFYWLCPTAWYVVLAVAGEALVRVGEVRFGGDVLSRIVLACVIVLTARLSLSENEVWNTDKAVFGVSVDATSVTWRSFFAEDLFSKMREDVGQRLEQEGTISIGLYPSIALYNGLMCLDGYSNNYPLEYKHAFGRAIEGELEADESLHEYFWGWGNRCYAFSHEVGKNYLVRADSDTRIEDLRMDMEALSRMGARYVLSAVEIEDCGRYGISLLGRYGSDECSYCVWLYELER